ncbi:MAG: cell division protein CrgA [Ornithinimicrobium sp.]
MPESSGRPGSKKSAGRKASSRSANPASRREHQGRAEPKKQRVGNPQWFVPVMSALMVVGVLWVATFYISAGLFPIGSIGYWNLGIGMGLIMAGFMMSTRWK